MVPLIVGGIAAGAGGAILNNFAGRKAAKQKARAINRWKETKARLTEELGRDHYAQTRERQAGLSDYLNGISSTMGTPASSTPQSVDYAPAEDGETGPRDEAWMAAYRSATAPQRTVDDAGLAATQAVLDRSALARALGSLDYTSNLGAKVSAPGHQRTRYKIQHQMDENDALLQAFQPSNGVYNLQLLGSLLGMGGQAALMSAPYAG